MNYRLYFRFASIFTAVMAAALVISLYPLYKYTNDYAVAGAYLNTLFFYVVILAGFIFVARADGKKGTMVNSFLSGIVINILAAMIYLFIVMRKFPGHEVDFAISFFSAFLISQGFEVYYILHNLRQN